MNIRPTVFLGSTSEAHSIASDLQVLLDHKCDVQLWSQGTMALGQLTLESLETVVVSFDFAIFVLTEDDLVESRGKTSPAPRDNILFELGLFMGHLGRDRTFIIHERASEIKLPTDLNGFTPVDYQMHANGNPLSSLGGPARILEATIEKKGIRTERLHDKSSLGKWIRHQEEITSIEQTEDLSSVWVLSPDLENDTSPEWKGVLKENAKRGVRYSYFVPETRTTNCRIGILQEAFKEQPGMLEISKIPQNEFEFLAVLCRAGVVYQYKDQYIHFRVFLLMPITDEIWWLELDKNKAAQFVGILQSRSRINESEK